MVFLWYPLKVLSIRALESICYLYDISSSLCYDLWHYYSGRTTEMRVIVINIARISNVRVGGYGLYG